VQTSETSGLRSFGILPGGRCDPESADRSDGGCCRSAARWPAQPAAKNRQRPADGAAELRWCVVDVAGL